VTAAPLRRKAGGARVVMARKGEQMSLIALRKPALDLAEFDIAGMPYVAGAPFAYSGRNLYRPGERFEVSVIARDADGHPVPPQPIQAILRRPDGKAQWTASWQPDTAFAGYYRRTIELPADAATGSWNLELRADPAAKLAGTSMPFAVEEFLPERMQLDLTTASERLSGREAPWPFDVSGRYLYGAPAAGNRCSAWLPANATAIRCAQKLPGFVFGDADEDSVRTRSELPESDSSTSRAGAKVEVDLDAVAKAPLAVHRARDAEPARERRPAGGAQHRAGLLAGAGAGRPAAAVRRRLRARGCAGRFRGRARGCRRALKAGTALPVRLFRENRNYYWRFDDQRGWHSGFTETDELVATTQVSVPAGGRGKLSLPVKYGRYRVEISTPKPGRRCATASMPAGRQRTTRRRAYAPTGWRSSSTSRPTVGDTARLTITPPHAGEALVTVEGDRALWVRRWRSAPTARPSTSPSTRPGAA
jgi:uncharacterized protein YfaS (alpha-2-macroglobulin family)